MGRQKILFVLVFSLLVFQLLTPSLPPVWVSGKQVDQEGSQERFSSRVETYWVEAGAKGTGESENNPAGNLTYLLDTYNLTDKVVKVKPGTYDAHNERFPLTLNHKGVTIEATSSPSDTIIYGPGLVEEDYPLIKMVAGGITIRGFTIGNYAIALLVISSGNMIQGNYITNNRDGIHLRGSKNVVRDNTITDNEIGVAVGGSNQLVTENNITANRMFGVSLDSCSNTTVKSNTITNNGLGIIAPGCANSKIVGNAITENGGYGVWVTAASSNNLIEGNMISGNSLGIFITCTGNTLVKNNSITNNRGYGILLEDTSHNTIEGNIITNNGKKAIKISLNVDDTTIRNNIIRDNGLTGNPFILLQRWSPQALATIGIGIAAIALTVLYFYKRKREVQT